MVKHLVTISSAMRRDELLNCVWGNIDFKELQVMELAGHADFKTTHKFNLAVAFGKSLIANRLSPFAICYSQFAICD